jgi:glycosyltransferase involved in cell wall biosynthesis
MDTTTLEPPAVERSTATPAGATDEVALTWLIPVFDEEESVGPIHARITEVMAAGPEPYRSYEILFVDDGSRDASLRVCQDLAAKDSRVVVVQFRRNFGKTAALHAGFKLARGRRVVTIDADMQEDPGDVFRLLAPIDAGDFDLVSAWRERRNDPLNKTLPSKVFNGVVANVTGLRLHDYNCGFKAYAAEVVHDTSLYGDQHRFIPLLVHQRGFRVSEVPVEHKPRKFGKSKYGTKRLLRGYLDFMQVLFLVTYLRRPMRLFGAVGTVAIAVGVLICLYLTVIWFAGQRIGNRPLLMLGILLILTGTQLISMGLIGEMLRHGTHRSGDEYTIRRIIRGGDQG